MGLALIPIALVLGTAVIGAPHCSKAGTYTRSHFSSTRALLSNVSPSLYSECVLKLLKLWSTVYECKPLLQDVRRP